MPTREQDYLFCITTVDGRLEPVCDEQESSEIQRHFSPGTRIDSRYLLQSSLGQGGMGHVFLALDERLDRPVALKVVSRRRIDEVNFFETMLQREAKLGAHLNHPGIATVHDFGVHSGKSYTVFEYVDGSNLRQILGRQKRVSLTQTREIVASLARALDFAHGNGIVHRDLKPENIIQAKSGEYKILDFGVAVDFSSDARQLHFAGTPAYSAPEQVAGKPSDGRTDQYALACVTYELLTGRKIFEAETRQEFLDKHLSDSPSLPSRTVAELPPEVDDAILRALAKDPEQRFASCQEFAEALGCEQEKVFFRRLQELPEQNRIDFFICHCSDDSIYSRRLANELDRLGFRTWYYQRNALPGLSLLAQTDEAIARSATCIILISRSAIESADLAREIQQAHRVGCALVPVLLDLSQQEFESLQPVWRIILGPIAKIEADRGSAPDLAQRIHAAASSLGMAAGRREESKTKCDRQVSGQIWATDGYQVDINELRQVVFENDVIADFMRRKNKCFVSATKGLGKTLLLTYKRLQLTEQFQRSGKSITMVPSGRPFLDFMGEMRFLSRKYEAPLSELTNAKRLWSAALRISAISYHENLIDDDEHFELQPFGPRIRRWLLGSPTEPTIVFKELTSLTVSEFNRLIDRTEGFLDQKLRQVHKPIYFFVDKVDQAIRNLGLAAWINVQAGLIEAAWDLMNSNSHLRVFASIRHEAFSNYESDIKSNLRGAVTVLRYSDNELADLMDRLSQCYEGAASFKEFVGLNVVAGGRRMVLEDAFEMVRRYTFGRPRDLVAIASEMSSVKSSLNEKKFLEIIREFSATGLINSIFDESRVFLDCLQDKESRTRFLKSLPGNILDRRTVERLTLRFNGMPDDAVEHFDQFTDLHQPFAELYLAGVLGVITMDETTGRQFQRFRQPDDLVNHTDFQLPRSPFYLVHPGLDGFIRKNRSGGKYLVNQQIAIGHQLSWRPFFELICLVEETLVRVTNEKFVDSAHEVMQKYQLAARNQSAEGMENILTSAEWKWLNQNSAEGVQADVVDWLNEMIKN